MFSSRWLTSYVCVSLLPSLDVVAVSQAPSPESNPNSPLPVTATVVHYTTVRGACVKSTILCVLFLA